MIRKEIKSEVTGSVWKIEKPVGHMVEKDETLMVLESMKMEIPVLADAKGKIAEISVKEGESISEGQTLAILEI